MDQRYKLQQALMQQAMFQQQQQQQQLYQSGVLAAAMSQVRDYLAGPRPRCRHLFSRLLFLVYGSLYETMVIWVGMLVLNSL